MQENQNGEFFAESKTQNSNFETQNSNTETQNDGYTSWQNSHSHTKTNTQNSEADPLKNTLQNTEKRVQTLKQNAIFAETRRKQQLEKTRLELAKQKSENQRYAQKLSQLGYQDFDESAEQGGKDLQITAEQTDDTEQANWQDNQNLQESSDSYSDTQNAKQYHQNIDGDNRYSDTQNDSFTQLQKGFKEYAAQIEREKEYFKKQYRDNIFTADVEKIKEKYPEIERYTDLPKEFFALMATGVFKDPVTAYQTILPQKNTPPPLGSVKSTQTIEKDYYSPQEVDRLSDKDLDEKTMNKIFNSMKKWK